MSPTVIQRDATERLFAANKSGKRLSKKRVQKTKKKVKWQPHSWFATPRATHDPFRDNAQSWGNTSQGKGQPPSGQGPLHARFHIHTKKKKKKKKKKKTRQKFVVASMEPQRQLPSSLPHTRTHYITFVGHRMRSRRPPLNCARAQVPDEAIKRGSLPSALPSRTNRYLVWTTARHQI